MTKFLAKVLIKMSALQDSVCQNVGTLFSHKAEQPQNRKDIKNPDALEAC